MFRIIAVYASIPTLITLIGVVGYFGFGEEGALAPLIAGLLSYAYTAFLVYISLADPILRPTRGQPTR